MANCSGGYREGPGGPPPLFLDQTKAPWRPAPPPPPSPLIYGSGWRWKGKAPFDYTLFLELINGKLQWWIQGGAWGPAPLFLDQTKAPWRPAPPPRLSKGLDDVERARLRSITWSLSSIAFSTIWTLSLTWEMASNSRCCSSELNTKNKIIAIMITIYWQHFYVVALHMLH